MMMMKKVMMMMIKYTACVLFQTSENKNIIIKFCFNTDPILIYFSRYVFSYMRSPSKGHTNSRKNY